MDITCTDCGSPCQAVRCRACAARARWRASNPPRACKVCHEEITGRSKARAVYCSRTCKFADPDLLAKIRRNNNVTKVCPHCRASFSVPASNATRYNYCSRTCSRDARGRDAACRRCGSAFRHGQTTIRAYCSEVCRRPPVMLDCNHCGETFRTIPSAATTRRFCTQRCYLASGAETSIECAVRMVLEAMGLDIRAQARAGRWTVDFMVGDLVIEADGSYWHSLRPDVDRRKTAALQDRGYTVWRIPEDEIRHIDFADVLQRRLIDHQVAHGDLPRLTPDEVTITGNEDRMVEGDPQSPASTQT